MWCQIKAGIATINIIAKPNAKKTALLAVTEQGLHISVHAKPAEGKANQELIRFLAQLFDLPKSQISLLAGETSRYKRVALPYCKKLATLLAESSI